MTDKKRMVQVSNGGWYVETKTGLEGPFRDRKEASRFLDLLHMTNVARAEFAGLQYTPLE